MSCQGVEEGWTSLCAQEAVILSVDRELSF